jgi:hypothetical protein
VRAAVVLVKAEVCKFGMGALDQLIEHGDQRVSAYRASLLDGELFLPIDLGISSPASHIERGERDCFGQALVHIANAVGPAARLIDCGYFAAMVMPQVLAALERPKAGIVLTATPDMRHYDRVEQNNLTAEISLVRHHACAAQWPLERAAAGRTLVVLSGGGFGLLRPAQAFQVLENASSALAKDDFVLITLEQPRDGALLEATYIDYGSQIINSILNQIGRSENLVPRVFCDQPARSIRLGAIADGHALISWNGTKCTFAPGTWLDMGAIHITEAANGASLHPDFEIEDQWTSGDQLVSLLLLRKI